MWIVAAIITIGLISWAAWQDRAQLEAALADELDRFLEGLLG